MGGADTVNPHQLGHALIASLAARWLLGRAACAPPSRLLFLMFSSVWLGPVPLFVSRSPTSRSPTSRPLLRSGRGLGLCRLLPGAGLAALF